MEENKSHIQYCVTWTIKSTSAMPFYVNYIDYVRNFENDIEANEVFNKILKLKNLYTANLCKVIKTTE